MSGLSHIYANKTATVRQRRLNAYGGFASGYPTEVEVEGNFHRVEQMIRNSRGEDIMSMGTFSFHNGDLTDGVSGEDQFEIDGTLYNIAMIDDEDMRGQINQITVFLR